ncbi:retron St85 family effector protein [Halomonas caseinilytica]|uniref:Uncharacterized protein n=1 Tax=Halomonas caseinilytica TaxID=438744 RepID=A0A1M6MLA6_9GAMM|nr:retron St85 family effector protein [Halomonas caseinilytica]SHJ84232.1 hypothetical protein SAMN05192556_10181 [Halomonas caseinilytica]
MSKITDSTYYRAISPIKNAVNKGRVIPLGGTPRLFFLCGANGHDGNVSYRRKQVHDFLLKNVENAQVIIAEKFFDEYRRNSREKNALDFEHVLTKVSEKVIIIMESPSAICELGAFAHHELRHKLIVINDSSFKDSPSFINTGPLEAVRECSDENRVLWYKMYHGDVEGKDGVAAVFHDLNSLVENPSVASKRIPCEDLDPSNEITAKTALFVHDLIFMMREVKYKSLINAVKIVFGESKKYDNVKKILTILISLGFIAYEDRFSKIKSVRGKAFFRYSDDDGVMRKGFFLDGLKQRMRA